jgi:hypothetical protein
LARTGFYASTVRAHKSLSEHGASLDTSRIEVLDDAVPRRRRRRRRADWP